MERAPHHPAVAPAATHPSHRRPLRVGLLATGGAALAALLFPAVDRPELGLVWNASASVPLGLYRIEPGATARVGDFYQIPLMLTHEPIVVVRWT